MDALDKPIPPKLYKYQSVDLHNPKNHTLENLRKCQLWFSRILDLNDPFDCSISIRFSATDEELLRFFNRSLDSLRARGELDQLARDEAYYLANGKPNSKLKKSVRRALLENDRKRIEKNAEMGVACLTAKPDSILMWSHYANGHRGLCLEFDTSYHPFRERRYVHPVIYSSTYPKLSIMDIIDSPTDFTKSFITKSKKWKYEEEWRILYAQGDQPLHYDPKALTAIYFGCAMSEELKARIASMPANSAASLFSMRRSDRRFGLEATPYPE